MTDVERVNEQTGRKDLAGGCDLFQSEFEERRGSVLKHSSEECDEHGR
jgi:hypothetical protein